MTPEIQSANERTKERKNERTKERKNERTKERKNERTKERTMLFNIVKSVVGRVHSKALGIPGGEIRSAVLADLLSAAVCSETRSDVVLASLVGDTILHDVIVGLSGVATVATIGNTVDENLRSKLNIRPNALASDADAVRKSRGGAVGPARSAVLGDVLLRCQRAEEKRIDEKMKYVSRDGDIVDTAHVTPVPNRRQSLGLDVFRRQRRDDVLRTLSRSALHAAGKLNSAASRRQ
jgi:hypothetical protein